MSAVARGPDWDRLMSIPFDAPAGSLPFAIERVQSVADVVAVTGLEAYLNTIGDKVRGVWWATDLQALMRVARDQVSEDGGSHDLNPPAELMPEGSDLQGTFGSVYKSLRSQGMRPVATGAYNSRGEWNYREMSTGRAGFSYAYRQRSGDHDPVAVISVSLTRPDWVPDRRLLKRGSSHRWRLPKLRIPIRETIRIDVVRKAWAESLRRAGLWKALPDASQIDCVTRVSRGEHLVRTLENSGWAVDGEDLAEGEVETLVTSMISALAERGVQLHITTKESPHEPGSAGYAVLINGKVMDLYRLDPNEPSTPLSDDPWLDCTIMPLRRINELLAEASSGDRVAVFEPGGNDGFAILASPAVLVVLLEAPATNERPIVP